MSQIELTADNSAEVTFTIVDNDGTAIAGTSINTLTFWIWNLSSSEEAINSRTAVVLTPASDYVDANGVLTHTLNRSDIVLNDSTLPRETHIVKYKWLYNTSADAGSILIPHDVIREEP